MNNPLTNLLNKEDLEKKLDSLDHPKLILLDIARFKQINLEFGDRAGDSILSSFSKSLIEFAKEQNLEAFHLKGDIFALVANMPFELSSMEKLIFSINDFCQDKSFYYKQEAIEIKLHIGICLDQKNLIKKALRALELAKKEDQPFVTYAQFVLNLLEDDEESTKQSIQTAIDEKKIIPHFQSIFKEDGTLLYKEMLLRIELSNTIQWPKFFLHVAQKYGLYEQILSLVLKKLVPPYSNLGINISQSDLFDESIFNKLVENFSKTEVVFEIQSYGASNPKNLAEKIKAIKDAHIQVCLDNIQNKEDLLPYANIEIDFIKVYGQSIRLLHVSDEAKKECKDLLDFAQTKGIKSIATHINSQATLDEAKNLGFDFFQGFFLAKPSA